MIPTHDICQIVAISIIIKSESMLILFHESRYLVQEINMILVRDDLLLVSLLIHH